MNFVPSYFKLQYLEICMISNKEVRKLVISLCKKVNVFKNKKKGKANTSRVKVICTKKSIRILSSTPTFVCKTLNISNVF